MKPNKKTKTKTTPTKTLLESVTDKIGEIAVHYGFTIVKGPHITDADISKSKQFKDFDHYGDAEEKVALTRWYTDARLDLESQPVAIHYKKPLGGGSTRKKTNYEMYGFEIMGSHKSTSEALLLRCALSVLEDSGHQNLYIDINSIGDKESINKFERELGAYYRKHAHTLPAKVRQELKKNNYLLIIGDYPETKELRDGAPQTVASLSEVGRLHFKEVLETLETFNTVYKIKSSVLSNKLFASNTVFEIRQAEEGKGESPSDELLAYGYRYNHLAKKLGGKREIPTVGVTLFVKKHPALGKKVIIKNIKKPKFYLVQLGTTAKLKALNIVEMLRKQKIPVYHSITKDKITGQLSGAEYMKATHVLVMGQKEAMENTMIVRSIANREQETVPLNKLGEFLKKLNTGKK